jgi:3-methyladenine DNA glycosylase AlkD
MNLHPTLIEIRQALRDNVQEDTLNSKKRFFKEEVKLLGLSVAEVTKISKHFYQTLKDSPKEDIFALCDELWKSGYSEEAYMACHFSYYISRKYEPADFRVFERWVNEYVTNWATCDTLCNHTVGTIVEKYPEYIEELKKWAKSPNRWVKRADIILCCVTE